MLMTPPTASWWRVAPALRVDAGVAGDAGVAAGGWPAAASRADSVASHVGSAWADLNTDSASRVSLEQRSQALPGKCSFTTSCQTVTGIR